MTKEQEDKKFFQIIIPTISLGVVWVVLATFLVNQGLVRREIMMWIAPIPILFLSGISFYCYFALKARKRKLKFIKALILTVSFTYLYFITFLISTFN